MIGPNRTYPAFVPVGQGLIPVRTAPANTPLPLISTLTINDDYTLDDLEATLIAADLGSTTTGEVLGALRERATHKQIGDVRVVGAMAGMELVRDRGTKEPADKETTKIIATAREKGLIILRCGVHHNVIRTLMPLTIPDELLEEGLDMLGASLGA